MVLTTVYLFTKRCSDAPSGLDILSHIKRKCSAVLSIVCKKDTTKSKSFVPLELKWYIQEWYVVFYTNSSGRILILLLLLYICINISRNGMMFYTNSSVHRISLLVLLYMRVFNTLLIFILIRQLTPARFVRMIHCILFLVVWDPKSCRTIRRMWYNKNQRLKTVERSNRIWLGLYIYYFIRS